MIINPTQQKQTKFIQIFYVFLYLITYIYCVYYPFA